MTKTPEEMAEEWSKIQYQEQEFIGAKLGTERAFLAGYQAAKEMYVAKLKEANDTIDGMVDECEGLKTIIYDNEQTNLPMPAKWISVKDRLPKLEHGFAMRQESECVLIACNNNIHVAHLCEKWCDRTQLIFQACDCDCRGHDMEQDEWELDQVTHWMELPAPPKEEE